MKYYEKDYPRPQFVRNNWENLNGLWDFAFDDDKILQRSLSIILFFSPRSRSKGHSYPRSVVVNADKTNSFCAGSDSQKGIK